MKEAVLTRFSITSTSTRRAYPVCFPNYVRKGETLDHPSNRRLVPASFALFTGSLLPYDQPVAVAVPSPNSSPSPRLAFTLVELLVVIVIISILLAVTIPAVNSLSKSSGGKSAVSNFMNVVEQARSLAITSGNATYIVFADESVTSADYRSRAFMVFQEKNFIPSAVSKWYLVPTGMSLEPANGLLSAPDTSKQITFVCPVLGSLKLPYLKFDPSGMVVIPDDQAKLFVRFFSGSVSTAGTKTFTDDTQKTSNKLDQVTISLLTGRAKYVDPYSPS